MQGASRPSYRSRSGAHSPEKSDTALLARSRSPHRLARAASPIQTDLASCVREVRDGTSDAIEIRSILDCDAASSCLVDLAGVNRNVHVFGAPGVSAGFRRTADYSYPILLLRNSSNVRVSNLEFNEEGAACKRCESTIRAIDSSNITLERLRVFGSKRMGIAFRGTDQLVIRDSEFANSGVFGIWSGIKTSTNVTIQNNFFRDTQSNAIFLSYVKSASILNNTFFHNHKSAVFATRGCGGPCPGGQIYVGLATGTLIASNVIADGVIDAKNTKGDVGGIEIDSGAIDVSIQNNKIYNNAGSGVYVNPRATDIRNVVVGSNKLYGNGSSIPGVERKGCRHLPKLRPVVASLDSAQGSSLASRVWQRRVMASRVDGFRGPRSRAN